MVKRIQERLVPLALLAVLAAGTNLSAQSLPPQTIPRVPG